MYSIQDELGSLCAAGFGELEHANNIYGAGCPPLLRLASLAGLREPEHANNSMAQATQAALPSSVSPALKFEVHCSEWILLRALFVHAE